MGRAGGDEKLMGVVASSVLLYADDYGAHGIGKVTDSAGGSKCSPAKIEWGKEAKVQGYDEYSKKMPGLGKSSMLSSLSILQSELSPKVAIL